MFTTVLVLMFCLSVTIAYADTSKTGTITATTLNLRSGASTDSGIIVTLNQGAVLTILKSEGNWYQVKTSAGTIGWVSSEYVGTTAAKAAAEKTQTGTITATTLNLRDSASTDSNIIVTLNQGASLTILKSEGNWYQVKTSAGTTGWVSAAYVATKNTVASRGDIDRTKAKDLASEIVSLAKQFLGVKYVWGGSSPSGFDCSGFVYYVFGKFNISLDRSSASMASNGIAVDKADLKPGDLVFFDTNGGLNQINHVGIYIGDGEFIQSSSSSSAKKVVISTLSSGFYKESYMRARRVF